MTRSKGWMIAGATAGLLLAGATRAAEPTDTAAPQQGGDIAGQGAAQGSDPTPGTGYGTGYGGQDATPGAGDGAVSGERRDTSGDARQAAPAATDSARALRTDESELAAGNTGGRG
jgi:hypothetical protein